MPLLLGALLTWLPSASGVFETRVTLPHGSSLWACVRRPELLKSGKPPLVVIHGGPQVPSDYLFPLQDVDLKRSVIFYDQLGCGRSDSPAAEQSASYYGVEQSVDDLRAVLAALDVGKCHLYGQSWGGLLAFEHASRTAGTDWDASVLSLVLSNTPSSVNLVEEEAARLVRECDGDVEQFMQTHNCRVGGGAEQPMPLAAAYAHAGSTWRGSSAITNVVADAEAMARVAAPCLVMRGQFDFVTELCVEGWKGLPGARFETLKDASHHALLEKPDEYLRLLGDFLSEADLLALAQRDV